MPGGTDSEASLGQQGADLPDRSRDGGALHAVQLGEGGVRKLKPQIDQRDHDLVGEEQFMLRPGSGLSLSLSAAPVVQRGLAACGPRTGQLLDQIGEMGAKDPGEGRMGQGRTGPLQGHAQRTRAAVPTSWLGP